MPGPLQLAAQGLDFAILLAQSTLDFLAPGLRGRNRLLQLRDRSLGRMGTASGSWRLDSCCGGRGVA